MLRRWLVVAGSVGVVGAFIACSSSGGTLTTPAPDSGGTKVDPVSSSSSSSGSVTPTACLDPTPIDATKIPYEPASPAVVGACTSDEVAAISTYYKENVGGAKPFDVGAWQAQVSKTCAACVFTDDSSNAATTWSPIVLALDVLTAVDLGGCVEHLGAGADCGRAYQQVQVCEVDACTARCATQQDFDACRQDASVLTTACKDAVTTVKAACGASLSTYETECGSANFAFEAPIRIACVSPPTLPSDAGPGDAGDAGDGG